jgi:hypothetical protein
MEDQFLNYTQSLALKELGFNEPCIAFYNSKKALTFHTHGIDPHFIFKKNSDIWDSPSAPLKQQVFRWFRNKYKYSSEIKTPDGIDGKWRNTVHKIYGFGNYSNDANEYNSYEEAEGAAIDTLIKLVKDDLERSN